MRFANATGTIAAQRTARGAHRLYLDDPADKARPLKELGVIADVDWGRDGDVDTLSYRAVIKVVGRFIVVNTGREQEFLSKYPSAEGLSRIWQAIMGGVSFEKCSFGYFMARVDAAAEAIADRGIFVLADGEWVAAELPGRGHLHPAAEEWGDVCRWLPAATIGDFYGDGQEACGSRAAADVLGIDGAPFVFAARNTASNFVKGAKVLTKTFASDDDVDVCDGVSLAFDIASGLRSCPWGAALEGYPQPGMFAVADLRDRYAVYKAVAAQSDAAAHIIQPRLPLALLPGTKYEALAKVMIGELQGFELGPLIHTLADGLKLKLKGPVHERALAEIEKTLNADLVDTLPGSTAEERVDQYVKRAVTHGGVTANPGRAGGDGHDDGQRQALARIMGTRHAIDQVERLGRYNATGKWSGEQMLEMALTGKLGPEALAELKTELAQPATSIERKAEIEKERREYEPLAPLHQLAWGQVKCLHGFPELQWIYELGQTRWPTLLGMVVARCYAPNRDAVPKALAGLTLDELAKVLRARDWSAVDLTNDADLLAVARFGGSASRERREAAELVYTCPHQIHRLRNVGTAVFSLFGAKECPALGWGRIVAVVDQLDQTTGWARGDQSEIAGRRVRTFVCEAMREYGKRVDLMRYSTRPDAAVARLLLGKESAPLQSMAEFASATAEKLKRARQDCEATENTAPVKLPRLGGHAGKAVASSGNPAGGAQNAQLPVVTLRKGSWGGNPAAGGEALVAVPIAGQAPKMVGLKLEGLRKELNKVFSGGSKPAVCLEWSVQRECADGANCSGLHPTNKELGGFNIKPFLSRGAAWPQGARRTFAP